MGCITATNKEESQVNPNDVPDPHHNNANEITSCHDETQGPSPDPDSESPQARDDDKGANSSSSSATLDIMGKNHKEYLISGWIRETNIGIYTGMDIEIIIGNYYPHDRPYKCMEYFKYYDRTTMTTYQLSNHDKRIKSNTNTYTYKRAELYHTIYGSVIINPAGGGIYTWNIKIHKPQSNTSSKKLFVGIDTANHVSVQDCFVERNNNYYAFKCRVGKKEKRGYHDFAIYGYPAGDCLACQCDAKGMAHMNECTCGEYSSSISSYYDYNDHLLDVGELSSNDICMKLDCTNLLRPKLILERQSKTNDAYDGYGDKYNKDEDIEWELDHFEFSKHGYCLAIHMLLGDHQIEIESFDIEWPT